MIETDHLKQVAPEELGHLRGDPHEARSAIRNQWSIEYDHTDERIKALTPLIGPPSWDEIQIPPLEDGSCRRIHADPDIEVTVCMERVSQVRAGLNASGSSV
ncbi:hypothetical protein [Streptomyces pratensis]|uniref:hypothetical protein n=1 Tax=Streptomyces pratensis TaxID=1169025 RepID=UPI0019328010|nr:hypothetical protein [Streptomyces pratensis]